MNSATLSPSAKLKGDWSIAGVGRQLSSLPEISMPQEQLSTDNHVSIDCGGIEQIDMSGLQLLYVWLHCIHMRGIQAVLCNVPEQMMMTLARLGLADNFACEQQVAH